MRDRDNVLDHEVLDDSVEVRSLVTEAELFTFSSL